MTKAAIVTARVDTSTLDQLDRMAEARDRSRAWLAAKAIERFVEEEQAFDAWLREGIDSADRGEFAPHEDVMARFRQRYTDRVSDQSRPE